MSIRAPALLAANGMNLRPAPRGGKKKKRNDCEDGRLVAK
jgi:hypothetical protein